MIHSFMQWLDERLVLKDRPVTVLPWTSRTATEGDLKPEDRPATQVAAWLSDIVLAARCALTRGPKQAVRTFLDLRTLRHSPFDAAFYESQRDRADNIISDPVQDYALHGDRAGRDPTPFFSTAFYLRAHRDVATAGINTYVHFLSRGHIEGRRFEPSNFGTGRPENYLHVEDWQVVPWPARDAISAAGLYGQRPDDVVIPESRAGETFLRQYDLLGTKPDFRGAISALQDLAPLREGESVPDVSVIIPVYGQLPYTLNCLHALLGHASKYRMEILVGDDASPDQTSEWLSRLENIRYVHHAQNSGFIRNCNSTAAQARGKFLVFLNNDTRVVDGWLDALVDSFTIFPDAGLVGSKLFYPDGTLQEAGGIVWQDGSAWNYGRNDDPNRSRYSHARKVDYVSGCSIALRRETWEVLNGFDTHFIPAYYEDTDLAFRVREHGQSVYMQPLSRVIHYEGKTSGTDVNEGIKSYQVENHRKFYERWKDTLARHRKNGSEPWLERQRDITKFALVIDTVTPTPTRDAGSVATVALIRSYQALGYHVLFLAEDNFLFEKPATSDLQGMGVECLYAPYETSLAEVLRRYAPYLSVLQVIRPEPARRALAAMKQENIRLKTLYLNADLHFLRLQRQAEILGSVELLRQADTVKAIELDIIRNVDGTFVHSSFEKNLLREEIPKAQVNILPLVYEVVGAQFPFADRTDIMFLGGFNHPPNLDAALWLIDDIWPHIEAKYPKAKLLIVGADPPPTLQARATDRIVISGHVADLAPWFERSRVFVAPIRFGAGAKGKIVSAMAHGVPVVATPLAVEGMGFDASRIGYVADDTKDIAQKVTDLYSGTHDNWSKFSDNAIEVATSHFSLSAMKTALQQAITSISA